MALEKLENLSSLVPFVGLAALAIKILLETHKPILKEKKSIDPVLGFLLPGIAKNVKRYIETKFNKRN